MASKDSIAVKRMRAMGRINTATRALAEKLGRDYPSLPTQGRDPALVHANQLETVANILEDVVKEGEKDGAPNR